MRVGSVKARDVIADGSRLNGGFHLAEDQQAWRVLSSFPSKKKTRLDTLGPRPRRLSRPHLHAHVLHRSEVGSAVCFARGA